MKIKANDPLHQTAIEDQFGKRVAKLLEAQSNQLDDAIQNQLSQMRAEALGRAKLESANLFGQQAVAAQHCFTPPHSSHPLWTFSSWLIPLAAVVFGIIAISEWQEDLRIKDIATVDIALLTDDVPPNAFADNGYMAYLKLKTVAKPRVEEKKTEDERI